MPHSNNINYSFIIVDGIDYPVIANTGAPQVFSSLNFAATFGNILLINTSSSASNSWRAERAKVR
jgi:hypothetical protein